jgi:hypothetical protein
MVNYKGKSRQARYIFGTMSTYVRFRRRLHAGPFWLNINKRSISTSIGVRGAHLTFGRHGRRATVGLPGSGLSVTDYQKYPPHVVAPHPGVAFAVWIILGLIVLAVILSTL